MIITNNGKEYFVDFIYEHPKRKRSKTWCFIKNKSDKNVVAQACSIVDSRDNFVKKIGRKTAFTKALKIFENNRNNRKN